MTDGSNNRNWLRCYRCWSQNLEVQLSYEGVYHIDPQTGLRSDTITEEQESIIQCLDCLHDQPHLKFRDGEAEPVDSRWERMITGTPWVASCTVELPEGSVRSCSGPEAPHALAEAALGDNGVNEFFTHVRFHTHEAGKLQVHMLVELYARSLEEARTVLENSAAGDLAIASLAEETRPPSANNSSEHGASQ